MRRMATGARGAEAPAPAEGSTDRSLLVAGLALAAGVGIWQFTKRGREEKKDAKKLARMGAELERDQMIARTHALVSKGMSPQDAEATAQREAVARVEAMAAVHSHE